MPDAPSPTAPYWSVMIPAYNRELVREVIRSVLAQDQGPERMQIEVVDNCSPDIDLAKLVAETGGGRVEFHRNDVNVGMCGNWNVCIKRARGQWVHILHDDDVVYPGYYRAMEAAGECGTSEGMEVGVAYARADNIDMSGRSLGQLMQERDAAGIFPQFAWRCMQGNPLLFPGIAVKRTAYEALGGFDTTLEYCPDWEMWFRLSLKYAVWYDPRVLVGYRRHQETISLELFRRAGDVAGIRETLRRFQTMVTPTLETRQVMNNLMAQDAQGALRNARRALAEGDLVAAMAQLHEGMTCSAGPEVLREMEQGMMKHWDEFVRKVEAEVKVYMAGGIGPEHAAVTARLRAIRKHLTRQVMEISPEMGPSFWREAAIPIGLLALNGLQEEPWTQEERDVMVPLLERLKAAPVPSSDSASSNTPTLVSPITVGLAAKEAAGGDDRWELDLMVAMMYCLPREMLVPLSRVPPYLLGGYVPAMFRKPRRLRPGMVMAEVESALRLLHADSKQMAETHGGIWLEVRKVVSEKMAAWGYASA